MGPPDAAPPPLLRAPSGATAPANQNATIRALWVLTATAVIIPLLLFVAAALEDRSVVLRRAEQDDGVKTIALLHEQAANLLSGHEIILDTIVGRVRGLDWSTIEASRGLLHELEDMDNRLDEASEILLVDGDGRVRASTVHAADGGAQPQVAQECFRTLRDGQNSTCVSRPHMDARSGQNLFSLCRRLNDAQGEFMGVAQVAISVDYFLDLWARVAHSASDAIMLSRADGVVIARYPPQQNRPPRIPADDALMRAYKEADHGVIASHVASDGRERITVYQQVEPYPVFISIGLDVQSALGEWYHNLLIYGAFALAATLALVIAAVTALRRAQRERHAIGLWQSEIKEREATQAQLLQSQKMESIGQLTGGVAHDFNNLLTSVIGNIDLARKRLTDGRARQFLNAAEKSADRGILLTRRLLAFARKQVLQPMSVDLRRLVADIEDLLVRTLGSGVRLSVSAEPQLWPALIDRNQIEMALLNLALNAHDAMPRGGALTIALTNRTADREALAELPPGDYVCLSVADTGTGMDEATLARACEPFFTTKEMGKGTGLGLAMVHGIVLQSGGAMRIRSSLGKGTTVDVWLPRAAKEAVAIETPPQVPMVPAQRAATILLCDDDEAVRDVIAATLKESGYRVIVTDNGRAALAVLEQKSPVDLLLVDFAMPEMNGATVARLTRQRRPDLPILLISGKADHVALRASAAEMPVLHKPFKQAELTTRIAGLLKSA